MKTEGKIEERVKTFNELNQQILETEARLEELKNAREQIRGQVALLQELAAEESPPTPENGKTKAGPQVVEAVAGEVVDS